MRTFHHWLDSRSQHHVYIVDPAIPATPSFTDPDSGAPQAYVPYTDGLANGVFVGQPDNASEPIRNVVWPIVPVVFPDFTHTDTVEWWARQVAAFFELGGNASGLWIDMNEPASFCEAQYTSASKAGNEVTPGTCRQVTGPAWSAAHAINLTRHYPSFPQQWGGRTPMPPPTGPVIQPPFLPSGKSPKGS